MGQMVIEYNTLSLSQQVLERQEAHARAIAAYVRDNGDISDATGLLLSVFDPLSRAAVGAAEQALTALATVESSYAVAVGLTALDVADGDEEVASIFTSLAGQVTGGPPASYPDLAGPSLPPASGGAPADYGSVDSYFWEKRISLAGSVTDGFGDARQLIDDAGNWGGATSVTEVVDASSYLVAPQAPDNFVQDLRWSAGLLLGSIDWVAEQIVGYSILERCVYQPLAGDWQGIYRASQAWSHGADSLMGVARNHAGLVASTPPTWQGLSGHSFRGVMTATAAAAIGLSSAFEVASGLVRNVSTVCRLACTGIGSALNIIADVLVKKAAEAAVPVFGWAVGAATAYSDINKVVRNVRLIYSLLETVETAISEFVDGKTAIFDKLAVLEDLAEGAARSAAA